MLFTVILCIIPKNQFEYRFSSNFILNLKMIQNFILPLSDESVTCAWPYNTITLN